MRTPDDRTLDNLMMQAVNATEFPPETRPMPVTPSLSPEEQAAYDARIRSGYYLPDVGAYEPHEGPLLHATHTRPVETDRPFHIGQPYGEAAATMRACAHCGGTTFELGIGDFYTALRCTTCRREWCQHEG